MNNGIRANPVWVPPKTQGGLKIQPYQKILPPPPHANTARIRAARYHVEKLRPGENPKGASNGDKNVLDSDQKCPSFWIKSCSHFGAEVGHILDQKLASLWIKSWPHFGPKVCPFLVQKCALFWTKSVTSTSQKKCTAEDPNVRILLCSGKCGGIHSGLKVCPFLDQKWSRFWIKSVPFSGPKVCPFLVQKCALFWTKSVSFFGPKVWPVLDQKCVLF